MIYKSTHPVWSRACSMDHIPFKHFSPQIGTSLGISTDRFHRIFKRPQAWFVKAPRPNYFSTGEPFEAEYFRRPNSKIFAVREIHRREIISRTGKHDWCVFEVRSYFTGESGLRVRHLCGFMTTFTPTFLPSFLHNHEKTMSDNIGTTHKSRIVRRVVEEKCTTKGTLCTRGV